MKLLKFLGVPRFSSSKKSTQKIQRKLNIRVSKKQIYQEAFTHSSVNLKNSNGQTINFERLEFLGDALLASIVAEYLFEYYPNAKEGELTKLRAKIVSRSKLNEIGKQMDLFKFAKISDKGVLIFGSALVKSFCILEENVFINAGTIIGHHVTIKKNTVISLGVLIGGRVVIEEEVFIGMGAKIFQNVRIGKGSIIGAGVIVRKNMPPFSRVL